MSLLHGALFNGLVCVVRVYDISWSYILAFISTYDIFRPNKKICVFRVKGLKILGRVGTHIFLIIFFLLKCIKLYYFFQKIF